MARKTPDKDSDSEDEEPKDKRPTSQPRRSQRITKGQFATPKLHEEQAKRAAKPPVKLPTPAEANDASSPALATSVEPRVPPDLDSDNSRHSGIKAPFATAPRRRTKPTRNRSWRSLGKYFLGAAALIIMRTFGATTQYGKTTSQTANLRQTFKSPNPILNVPRRPEAMATDTVKASVPAVDNGSTAAQYFVGRESLFQEAYGVRSDASLSGASWIAYDILVHPI